MAPFGMFYRKESHGHPVAAWRKDTEHQREERHHPGSVGGKSRHQRQVRERHRAGQKNLTILTLEKIAKGLDVELFELLMLPAELEPKQRASKAIESLLKHADAKTLNLCLDFLRKASS